MFLADCYSIHVLASLPIARKMSCFSFFLSIICIFFATFARASPHAADSIFRRAAAPSRSYSTVTGFFLQDDPSTDASSFHPGTSSPKPPHINPHSKTLSN